jgi:hypothetical protein
MVTLPHKEVTPAKRHGCLGWFLGCFGIAIAFVVILVVAMLFAGGKTALVRSGIAPGMPVEDVVEHTRGWLSCRAHAERGAIEAVEFQVGETGYTTVDVGTEHTFATRQQMARALAAEFGRRHTNWRMTFGYLTIIPKRIYFDVEFSPDGRVTNVSETRWGRLN